MLTAENWLDLALACQHARVAQGLEDVFAFKEGVDFEQLANRDASAKWPAIIPTVTRLPPDAGLTLHHCRV